MRLIRAGDRAGVSSVIAITSLVDKFQPIQPSESP
jgi:hypothetical protein